MPKKIQLKEHLSTEQLEARYRGAHDPVERSHYQIIWLLSQGLTTTRVMQVTGYSRSWIQEIARRYNRYSVAMMGDNRHNNPGGEPLLDRELRDELAWALRGDAPDRGLWNGPKVAAWIAHRLGVSVSARTGWAYLRRVEHTPKVPRPAHQQQDPRQRAAFPKG